MKKDRVAVTGSTGQLGESIVRLWADRWDVVPLGGQSLDLASWPAVRDAIAAIQPRIVVHAAAATDVDRCEVEPDWAYRVNAIGTRHVARAATACGASLAYISTNYVFDGRKPDSYHEFDSTGPISVYGASKLAGEIEARATAECYVVRTAWLYGRTGRNFVSTMRRLMAERDYLTVVEDQRGNPTFVDDLALAIEAIVTRGPGGTYHAVNAGVASWHEWAVAIAGLVGAGTEIRPIPGADYRRAATPPTNGALASLALPPLGVTLPDWRDALQRCLSE
ncbi:MAG TPA: dTDP-4-dehydrorhamnose reductase [Thermomicrobiales bacterium]|nr:dTDP-4-dehydrorhamnose reductase [Thermomicrobiales bacterium]HQZ88709.1 dTDP-4-dehydrorhamnose reductase [Thermomicrobiales bacterium]